MASATDNSGINYVGGGRSVELPPSCGMRAELINARSSVAYVRELRLFCSKNHLDFIGVMEIFLRDANPNNFFFYGTV
jgi:hypothetical protein